MKNKKTLIIIAISIIVVILVLVGVCFILNNQKTNKNSQINSENFSETETNETYKKVSETKEMAYTFTLDDNNKKTIYIKDNNAYKEVTSNGVTYKYIVKDGNTYYLDSNSKKYYTYKNNTTILSELKLQLQKLQELSGTEGKEKINGKTYKYEEFEQYQGFLINSKIAEKDITKAKTRIYYDNDKIVYIKTIAGDNEELLKVDISYSDVDNDYFNIPSEYKNGDVQ